MSQLYRAVEIINDESTEPVAFVGVHPVRWHQIASGKPTTGFVPDDDANELRQQRDDLLVACKALYDYCNGYWAEYDVKHDDIEIIDAIYLARDAIAKAERTTPD